MQGSQQQAMAASVKQRGAPTVVTILLGVGPLYVTIHIGVAPPPTSWSTFGGYTGGAASPAPCCTSGVSASHVCGAFRCIGFDGPVQERLQRCILCVCVCVCTRTVHTHTYTHTHTVSLARYLVQPKRCCHMVLLRCTVRARDASVRA